MTAVKICGLTRAEDARAAAVAGAQAVGVILAPSPRQVTPARAKRILAQVPTTVLRIGVFVDQDWEWVCGVAAHLRLDRIQVHGAESNAYLRHFTPEQCIRALRPPAGAPLPTRDPAPGAGALLVDAWVPGQPGGTGKLANWAFAKALRRLPKTLILSGGLHAGNVAEGIRRVHPDMVDVASGVEVSPGIKNHVKIRAFIQAVRQADRA